MNQIRKAAPPDGKARCTHLTTAGQPCRAWALTGSDPPTCAMHAGRVTGQGAPAGNRNAVRHGFFAEFDLQDPAHPPINGIIHDLVARQEQLSAIIDDHLAELTIPDLARLLAIHGQNASRLGRLLRDRRALGGDAADGFTQAIGAALNELGTMWGVDLT